MNRTKEKHGLISWLEQTRIELPLKGVEGSVRVVGDVVAVELDQIYHQNNQAALDCTYTFPLPAGAAVYRCEMHVNGRVIRAKVEEEEAARKLVKEKKEAGYRTSLVEMERDNLFTLSMGNLQPGDMVVIRLAWFEVITRLEDWASFRVPLCPGQRYIPGTPLLRASSGKGTVDDTDQVPDASRISPPRMDRLHRDAAYVSMEVSIRHGRGEIKEVSSPSHAVLVRDGEGETTIGLASDQEAPDKDFVVRWTEVPVKEVASAGWVTGDEAAYALLRLRAPKEVAKTQDGRRDIYLLIDRSGSMQGLKWEKAVLAAREFVNVIGEQNRIWISLFENTVRDFAERPMMPAELRADRGFQNLLQLGVGGGTELLPAVQHVLGKVGEHSAERKASLILITDGEIGNEEAVLNLLARHQELRVDVFGIDVTLNDGFLRKLAAQNRGTSALMSPNDDIAGAVRRLGQRLGRPVLTDIVVSRKWETSLERLPDLHAGEVLVAPLRARAKTPGRVTVHGKLGNGQTYVEEIALAGVANEAFCRLWGRQRMDTLLAGGKKTEAIELAKTLNVICEGTAFVAWDEAEKVTVSTREICQPALEALFDMAPYSTRPMVASMMDTQFLCCCPPATPPPNRHLIDLEIAAEPLLLTLQSDASWGERFEKFMGLGWTDLGGRREYRAIVKKLMQLRVQWGELQKRDGALRGELDACLHELQQLSLEGINGLAGGKSLKGLEDHLMAVAERAGRLLKALQEVERDREKLARKTKEAVTELLKKEAGLNA